MSATNKIKAVENKDYVVADVNGKPSLIRVLGTKEGTLRGKHEYRDQSDDVEVQIEDVKANLGPTPNIGTVFGCKTERLIDVTDTKPISVVEWFFEADADEQEAVHEGILAGAKLLKKHNVHRILKVVKARVVLNTAKKLTAKSVIGTYKTMGASEDNPDVLTIKYHKDSLEHLPRLMVHEAGHGIWYRLMSMELHTKWIYAFFKQSEVTRQEAEVTADAIKLAVKERSIILTDTDLQSALDAALGQVEATTGLRKKDVFVLLSHNPSMAKEVLGPWRTHRSVEGVWETHVTDYANTNVEEMFSEALANYCTGMALPEYLKELFDETLEEIQGRDVLTAED